MSEFNSRFPLTWSNWDDNPDSSEQTSSSKHRGGSDSDDSSENESSKHKVESSSRDMESGENNGTWTDSLDDNSTHWESSETSSSDMENGENNGTWTESSEDNSTHWESSEWTSSEMERAGRNGSEEHDGRESVHNDTGGWRLTGNTTHTHSWCVSVRETLWRIDECVHNFSYVCELSNVPNATDGWAFDNSGNVLSARAAPLSQSTQCRLDGRASVVLLSCLSLLASLHAGIPAYLSS